MPIPEDVQTKNTIIARGIQPVLNSIEFRDIPAELFDTVAANAAIVVANAKKENATTQLRKFYNEIVMWDAKITDDQSYLRNAPLIKMLNAKAAYAQGRGHIDDNFKKLVETIVQKITDCASLKNAKLFFEAFMGFYKQVHPK